MSKVRTHKVCPLRFFVASGGTCTCVESACMWYSESHETCAIHALGPVADVFSALLDEEQGGD